ncbi:nuclease-related domain-containing DEAD/DEAH box helicase [Herbaspirillum sp. SJZ107]|uniref:nuclease-related domain-containing DEAD/DEAH box helicase n=1 Tax=Herbaspirillum sp. SJZ107 TaxID=2572881 RepID=UPI00114D712A|nr:NERD domain-containing protein [Herbaspirillum sp. SJZ107]TQK03432.1 nuclease-like protein [Herbaspirillum sp. SJZ107]
MQIYPRFKFRPRLLGEASVHDLLSRIDDKTAFAVHSVNLPEHEYKRWGEADFVVVSRAGVVLLEVKGGNVDIAGRVWRYENARGQAIESSEGPARQAISAAVALERLLGKRLGRKVRCRWGVVFPLCSFKRHLDELPPERLADRSVCAVHAEFAQWLVNIPFDQHTAADFALSEAEVDEIRSVLLPELSAASSLGLSAAGVEQGIVKLTRQQYAILESLTVNPRLLVTGGAGTGKTELAVLCARAELAAGHRPAILAQGRSLARSLERRLADSGIPVCSNTVPEGCDVLIVDEGQDLVRPEGLERIFSRLPGGMEHGRWRWFMDPNLQYLDAPPDAGAFRALQASSASVELSRNVRSTREIVCSIQAFLAADIGLSSIDGYGVRVGFHQVRDVQEEADSIEDLVAGLLHDGVLARDIAVLGANGGRGPVASSVAGRLSHVLRPLTATGDFASGNHGVIADIRDFRGLESRVVILADLEIAAREPGFARSLYIGMTRASVALHLFTTDQTRQAMVTLLKQNSRG